MSFKQTLLALLSVAGLLSACNGTGVPGEEVQSLSISPESKETDAGSTVVSFSVYSDYDWIARSDGKWAKLNRTSGKAGVLETVSITVEENNTGEVRTATVAVTALNDESKTFTITQTTEHGAYSGPKGINNIKDLADLSDSVSKGGNLARFIESGRVLMRADIDASGVDVWKPIGTKEHPFELTFDGAGHTIKGVNWSCDLSSCDAAGLFGYCRNATIKELNIGSEGDVFKLKGTNADKASASALVAYSDGCTILHCTNNVSVLLEGDSKNGVYLAIGGLVGYATGSTVVGDEKNATLACMNYGNVTTAGKVSNTGNGSTGLQIGGICGYSVASSGTAPLFGNCTNYGHVAAPTGRGGGITGTLQNGTIARCTNRGLIEDDIVGQFDGVQEAWKYKRMGGISGSTGTDATVENCTNHGNVVSHLCCRCAGFVSHSTGVVTGCTNRGSIIGGESTDGQHGPAWGCAYNGNPAGFSANTGYGFVGDENTPALISNAVFYPKTGGFDTENVTVDRTLDAYYDWIGMESKVLSDGLVYTKYSCTAMPRIVNVLEIDLKSQALEVTACFADDIVPNPNGNKNSNNGFNLRETLSQLCNRKRTEGNGTIAGVNCGFFDSNDGIARGFHVEKGEPVYINNPSFVKDKINSHGWAFTVFDDGTASCGKKEFSGKLKIGESVFDYYTINDTTVRHSSSAYPINLYTSRYVKTPHPNLTNPLSKDVMYVVAKYTGTPMKVNAGYSEAVVTRIVDGLAGQIEPPYLTSKDEVCIAVSQKKYNDVKGRVEVGTKLNLRCDISVDGSSAKKILTQVSTMYQFLLNGTDNSQKGLGSTNVNLTTYDPMTFVAVSKDASKAWLVEVDGRQPWSSMGLKSYEIYRIALKLGAWNATRFDGGGSSAMWVYDSKVGKGGLVNKPSDSKGERSCMNYVLINTI